MKIPNLTQAQHFKDRQIPKMGVSKIFTLLNHFHISPNNITALGKLFGLLSIVYLFEYNQRFIIFYVVHQILDGIDGSYARFTNQQTESGMEFDHIGDLVVHTLILAKSVLFGVEPFLATIALLTYLGEFVILRRLKLDSKKFPSSLFAIFYIFGFYKLGLIAQIGFQLISLPIFLFLHREQSKSDKDKRLIISEGTV